MAPLFYADYKHSKNNNTIIIPDLALLFCAATLNFTVESRVLMLKRSEVNLRAQAKVSCIQGKGILATRNFLQNESIFFLAKSSHFKISKNM